MGGSARLSKQRIRILIADADNMGSQLLAGALKRSRNRFDVVALASSAHEAIREAGSREPHVAVVSPELQDGPEIGFKVLQRLRESHPAVAGVMLLHSHERDAVIHAFQSGARGVCCRTHTFKTLSECIRSVHRGQIWASNQDLEFVLEALARLKPVQLFKSNGMDLLTRREGEVVQLVIEGMKNGEIAAALHVREHTVRNYLYRIFEKLGVSSRVELVLYAISERDSALKRDAPRSNSKTR